MRHVLPSTKGYDFYLNDIQQYAKENPEEEILCL